MRTRIGVLTHLAPAGPLTDEGAVAALQEGILSCVESREIQIVVDLTHVPVLNSAALEALLDSQDQLTRKGGWVKVGNANPLIQNIFLITGVGHYVTVLNPSDDEQTPPPPETAPNRPRRLGEILVEKELITEDKIEEAMRLQAQSGKRMGQIILDKGWVPERDFFVTLSEQLKLPFVKLRPGLYDAAAVATIDKATALRLRVLPLFRVRGVLNLATNDPQSIPSFEEIEDLTGCTVKPVLATREDISKTIHDAYAGDAEIVEYVEELDSDFELVENQVPDDYTAIDELASGSPVINLVNSIIQRAVRDGASDVHIEPSRQKCRIRLRIDGILYEVMTPRVEMHPPLVSRLKVMANLDIAERRLPQDGRIQVITHGRTVDLRFSSMPGIFGEKVVLRVLDKNQSILNVNKLGIGENNLDAFLKLLANSYGLILVTGPTGSGKTTSLYAAINYLNSLEKNIVTIEDPVEYQIDIVNQNQVKDAIGLTFAKILKHVLRQDPDIVMVGEIREQETAEIAVQAALTGHLVLSTLHTSDCAGAVTRMLDMGIEPYMLTSALIGVVAQRLVRQVCPECSTSHMVTPELVKRYNWDDKGPIRLFKGRGCPACYDSGYKGRLGLHEVMPVDSDLQKLILANPTREGLIEHRKQNGEKSLFDDGLEKVVQGLSTVEEISRVVNMQ